MSGQEKFILRVLELFERYDQTEKLMWGVDGNAVVFYVNCGDLFSWGSIDAEDITPETVDVMEQSFADCANSVGGVIYADSLYAARMRKMRPQGAWYEDFPKELCPLFDACGPEREVGPGNPRKQPGRATS